MPLLVTLMAILIFIGVVVLAGTCLLLVGVATEKLVRRFGPPPTPQNPEQQQISEWWEGLLRGERHIHIQISEIQETPETTTASQAPEPQVSGGPQ